MKLVKKANVQQKSPVSVGKEATNPRQVATSNSQMILELTRLGLLGDTHLNEFDRHKVSGKDAHNNTNWLDHMENRENSREDMCLPPAGDLISELSPALKEKTSGKSPPETDN